MSDPTFRLFYLERDGATVGHGVVFPEGPVVGLWQESGRLFAAIDVETAEQDVAQEGARIVWLDQRPSGGLTGARLFHLQRDVDESGVSGEGVVAEGVMWSDRWVATHWLGNRPSTAVWHHPGVDDPEYVHGHGGKTRVVWLNEPSPAGEPKEIRDLPASVRQLVHAVDAMRDGWPEGDESRRGELWQRVHHANDAVWNRGDHA